MTPENNVPGTTENIKRDGLKKWQDPTIDELSVRETHSGNLAGTKETPSTYNT